MAKEQWETYFDAVRKEDWKAAKYVLQLISKQERNNSQTYIKIGDVCQRTGDKTEAIAAYTHAAQLLRMQGFAQKALATYKIALRLDPANPEIIRRAEILMDEFETAKTAPHIPAAAHTEPQTVAELPLPPEQNLPEAVEVTGTSDWLERTAVSPDVSEENIMSPETVSSDMGSLFESTSLAAGTTGPRDDAFAQIQVPAISEPELSKEETAPDAFGMDQAEEPASESDKAPEEDGEWLESAYEALDTRMFKPEAERPSRATVSGDDAINLIFARSPVEPPEELTGEMKELFLTPLSQRQERTIPEIFWDLPEAVATNFMNDLTIRKYRDRQHVIEEGDSGDSMYVIRAGRTRVVAHMLGRELELAVLGEGDVFGEVGFLTGRPRTAAVIADGPVEVYEISRLDIEKLIETNPDIIARIEDFYETRVRDTIRKVKS